MDVPEPSTVIFSGAWGMLRLLKLVRKPGRIRLSKDCCFLRPSLGFCLRRGLCCYRLIDLEIGHFQFAKQIEEEAVFLGREVSLGFLVQGIEHVDQLMGGFRVDDGLAGARIGIGAEDHRRVAADHADEIFEWLRSLGKIGGRLRRGRLGSFGDRMQLLLALGLAFLLFHRLFAGFTLGGKGTAVDNSERIFLLVIGQGNNPLQYLSG